MGKKSKKNKIWKKIYRSDIFVKITAQIYVLYLFFTYYACFKEYHDYDNLQNIWDDDAGIILCFWHSRLMLCPYTKRPKGRVAQGNRKACAFISPHRDGKYSAVMTKYLDASPIYGSTTKGAKRGLKEALRHLKNRAVLLITPDGPRGPAEIASAGSVQMSQLTDAWILPMAYSPSRKITISTWDKLLMPLPFGKLHFAFGKPFKASDFENLEACRLHLQEQLNAITALADKKCGL